MDNRVPSVPPANHNSTNKSVRPLSGCRRALCVTAIVMLALLSVYVVTIKDFLCLNRPVGAGILVIESWYEPDPTLRDAVTAIRTNRYQKVLCVALRDDNQPSSATRAVRYLLEHGVDATLVHAIDAPPTVKHRTFATAIAARGWIEKELPGAKSVDVLTKSIHARKSYMLFRKAFQESVSVGVIAAQAEPFPRNYWWLSGRGIYLIVRNTAGCLAAIVFEPPADQAVSSEKP